MFDDYYRQERSLSKSSSVGQKNCDQSRTNSDLESPSPMTTSSSMHNQTSNGNRVFNGSSSSTRTSDSQMSISSFQAANRRTCGARFSGTTQLICFGRIANNQPAPSIPASAGATNDSAMNRPQSLPMRSTSLTATKTRENSHTDEHSSYRPTPTNTVQIQQHSSNNQRLPMFSAPVRSSLSTSLFNDHQHRVGSSYRYSLAHRIHPPSNVSIYDVTILLPISKKLADDYQIDLNNPMEMCEGNEQLTSRMAKKDLTQCWSLLAGLLSIEPNLKTDDPWFQTPIAQGRIELSWRRISNSLSRVDQTSRLELCQQWWHSVGQYVSVNHVSIAISEDEDSIQTSRWTRSRSNSLRIRFSSPSLETLLQTNPDSLTDRSQLSISCSFQSTHRCNDHLCHLFTACSWPILSLCCLWARWTFDSHARLVLIGRSDASMLSRERMSMSMCYQTTGSVDEQCSSDATAAVHIYIHGSHVSRSSTFRECSSSVRRKSLFDCLFFLSMYLFLINNEE